MQRGEIYGFFYIPEGTSAKAQGRTAAQTLSIQTIPLLIAGSLPLQGHEDDERIGIRCRST